MSRWEPTKTSLEHLAELTWGCCSEFLKPDSCVLASRVLVDVLHRLGEPSADGWSTQAIFYNLAAWRHCEQHDCTREPWACKELSADATATVAVLGGDPSHVERTPLSEYWRGHLAVAVRRRWVVDLTAHQLSHPELGLPLEGTLVFPANEDLLRGRKCAVLSVDSGVHATYAAAPGTADDWRQSPDWAFDTNLRVSLGHAVLARLAGRPYEHPQTLRAIFALTGRI